MPCRTDKNGEQGSKAKDYKSRKLLSQKQYNNRRVSETSAGKPTKSSSPYILVLRMPVPNYERCHRIGKPSFYKPRPLII